MQRYFDEVRQIVERHEGVVEKFVGDAVKAVFGIPVEVKADVYAALGEVLAARGKREDSAAAVDRAVALHEAKGNVVSAARLRGGGRAIGVG